MNYDSDNHLTSPTDENAAIAMSEPSPDLTAWAAWLKKCYDGEEMPESVQMLLAVASGSEIGPGDGWFGPGQSRYDWNWLARRHGAEASAAICREQFRGPSEWFDRFDRNLDGRLTADDFDWSNGNPFVRRFYDLSHFLRRLNQRGDGRLTRDEWLAFFDRAAAGRDYITVADLAADPDAVPDPGPTPEVMIRGMFRGELGSLYAGPRLNDPAPDFTLRTHDGARTIRLAELIGPQPVVLVLGNFTCGPFRAFFPVVDDLARLHRDRARFLGVYVRESHPTGGWRVGLNDRVGVALPQPASYDERVNVAARCQMALDYSMPLLVDEINDPVGHAYSGMPARLYVIDTAGRVAYKSGRGPFGFKPGEMEQSLLMCLLDGCERSP